MIKLSRLCVLVALALVLGASSALAANFSVSGGVLYGSYLMCVDESDRYGSIFPLYYLDASATLFSDLKLSAEYITGTSPRITEDLDGYYEGNSSYSPYSYTALKCDAAWPVFENVALLAGYSSFTGALDWDNSAVSHDWYYASGSGFKLGFEAVYPFSDRLSASVKYAFLPRVYAQEYDDDGFSYDYEWLGTGHELDAKVAFALTDRLSLEGGFKSDAYLGVTSCCSEQSDVSLSAGYLGVKFSF